MVGLPLNSYIMDTNNSRFVTVENLKTGEIFVDKADVVISARGSLNEINWPQIPGLDGIKIPVMHSAAWDDM